MAADKDPQRAERIKTLRNSLALTQRGFADAVGVGYRTVQQWEAGGNIEYDNAVNIARVTKTTALYILNGNEGNADGEVPPPETLEQWMARMETLIQSAIGTVGERRRGGAMRGGFPEVSGLISELRSEMQQQLAASAAAVEALTLELARLRRLVEGQERSATAAPSRQAPPSKGS